MSPEERLAEGAAALGLQLPPGAAEKLVDYLRLVDKWNKVYNLTAVRDPRDMLSRHVLDCLAIVPWLRGASVLDVGSGAGLPGIPIALALPSVAVTLLDSSQKRAAFLRQAVIELGLSRATVVCARVEEWEPGQQYDVVVSRALTDLAAFIRLAGRHVAANGSLAVMKGVLPRGEVAELPTGWSLGELVPLAVPGVTGERHWVRVQRNAESA